MEEFGVQEEEVCMRGVGVGVWGWVEVMEGAARWLGQAVVKGV